MDEQNRWLSEEWLAGLAAGDPIVTQEFWDDYAVPLQRVADRQLSQQLKRRVDAEDVVQSACRTFFRRVQHGEFEFNDRDDLWRLLLTITLNKARMQARFHGRARRGLGKEQSLEGDLVSQTQSFDQAIKDVDFADSLDVIFEKLDDEQCEILRRLLDGETQEQIANAIGCSQRTVRRMQVRIREQLQSILANDLGSKS